jgi:ribosome-interacting GTPase 1
VTYVPANLTPEFLKARERFRAAQTPEEKLNALEEMLSTIPKHKGTDKMQADIKRRIAKLRSAQQSKKRHGQGSSWDYIEREGSGQVSLVGPPNSGKSSLLAALTNARPEIGDYPYSTIFPIPGMMTFEDVSIQLIDLPPISAEYTEGWVYSLVRQSDLILLVLDGSEPETLPTALDEIRLLLEGKQINLSFSPSPRRREDSSVQIIPCRLVLTKADHKNHERALKSLCSHAPILSTSAKSGMGLDQLRRMVFEMLHIVRVYTKLPGKPPDLDEPYTLPAGSTVLDAVRIVHQEFAEKLKYVRIWGSGKFDGQQVPSEHILEDKDIIEIHV